MRLRRYPFPSRSVRLATYLMMAIACIWVVGCTSPAGVSPAGNPKEQAGIEATAIIQRAQATALVLQAQSEATVLVRAASAASGADVAGAPSPASKVSSTRSTDIPVLPSPGTRSPVATPMPASRDAVTATPSVLATRETGGEDGPESSDTGTIELLGVEIGRESGLILVQFKAPPPVARKWQQGSVYVVDEATGSVYSEIPVAPVVGPLFGRPKAVGQTGYVMFSNAPVALQAGSLVTVVLGDFKQQHVTAR